MNFNNLIIGTLTTGIYLSIASKNSPTLAENTHESQMSLQPIQLDSNFIYGENINHILIGGRIISQFSPRNSKGEAINLQQLAKELGYDHFNWVNYVETDPYGICDRTGQPLATPYNDPPQGGYHYDAADSYPFYWDVVKCELCRQRHHFQDYRNLKQSILVFEDAPADYRLQPGEAIKFVTSLVGVKKLDQQQQKAEWEVLHTFRWQVTNPHPYYSQTSLLDTNVGLEKLSPLLLNTMLSDGALLPKSDRYTLN